MGRMHPQPLLIDGTAGHLFAVSYAVPAPSGRALLILPPFGEEMNRSRRMLALLARAVAARGVAVLMLDLFGTGDSGGGWEQASWRQWREDADRAVAWLSRGHHSLSVLGLRTGALLALETAAAHDLDRAVLWQPVTAGATFLTQTLRIRATTSAQGETVAALRARLRAGETLEVGGYAINPALADALEELTIEAAVARCRCPIHWFHLGDEAPAVATTLCEHLEVLAGPPFWSIEETTLIPDLIEATAALWPATTPEAP